MYEKIVIMDRMASLACVTLDFGASGVQPFEFNVSARCMFPSFP